MVMWVDHTMIEVDIEVGILENVPNHYAVSRWWPVKVLLPTQTKGLGLGVIHFTHSI